ncbi:MAG: Mth938-like domain-containing protein [Candidatus Brocadiia bacterium]
MPVDDYSFGRITVDGKTYTDDVIISPEGVDDSWWRETGHEVCEADLDPVWKTNPEILIIGTGARGVMKVLPEARELMEKRCDQLHVLPTKKACKKYNKLVKKKGKRVVAAFHLTC